MSRFGRTTLAAVVALAAVVGLAACTGTSVHGGSGVSGAANGAVAGAAAAHGGPAAAPAAEVPTSSAGAGGAAVAADVQSTAEIRTARMTVAVRRTGSVATQADRAEQITVSAGGEVDADDRTAGRNPSAVLGLRIPPAQLEPVLDRLARLGTERFRHLSTQDVTEHVADVNSRVVSAAAAIARLRVLYREATDVHDVIAIENELAGRESDLESLQAEQRALTAETAAAQVTLTLVRQAAPPARTNPVHHRTGFVGGLENGWGAFRTTVTGIVTGIGAVLPFVALFGALCFAGLWMRGRLRRRPGTSVDD